MNAIAQRAVRAGACAGLLALLAHAPAGATITVTLPTVTATPGNTVDVPIVMSTPLAGLNVLSIQYRLPFSSSLVSGATETGTGVIDTWGTPFSNTTATQYSVAAAGLTPVSSTGLVLETVRLTVAPGAPVPSDQTLTLTSLLFNEGTPASTVVDGVLHIRSTTAVGQPAVPGLALEPVRPNPARGPVRLAFSLPTGAGGSARLVLYGLDGRLVRVLADGAAVPGTHAAAWDGADARGGAVASGVYFARLEWAGHVLTRRFAVVH